MTAPVNKMAVTGIPQGDLERFRSKPAGSLEEEKARLKKATKEFESLVVYEMLKSMRKTIQETSVAKDGPFSGGMGKDIFEQMFDQQLSRQVANDSRRSVAEMLYKQVEKVLEAQYKIVDDSAGLKPFKPPESTPIPLSKPNFIERPKQSMDVSKEKAIGRLESPPQAKRPSDPIWKRYNEFISQASEEHHVDSALIASVIKAESNGDSNAVSPAGAKGLMQLIDSTAAQYGVSDPHNPAQNIRAGTKYLKAMLDRFGDLKLALAAYNAGPANVERYDGIPPFEETRHYVDKVVSLFRELSNESELPISKEVWDKSDNLKADR